MILALSGPISIYHDPFFEATSSRLSARRLLATMSTGNLLYWERGKSQVGLERDGLGTAELEVIGVPSLVGAVLPPNGVWLLKVSERKANFAKPPHHHVRHVSNVILFPDHIQYRTACPTPETDPYHEFRGGQVLPGVGESDHREALP
jgi:hypothetical protein